MISELIKKIMLECKLKQSDMVDVLGASLSRIKAITSGRVKNLTREESEALIGKLDIRADWLITGEGPMFQDDEESQDAFVSRIQAINRTSALINAMPLREFTRTRLCALMTGAHEQDGPLLAEVLRHEALGIDFVTRKPIDGAVDARQPLLTDEQMWLDCYREWDAPVKKRELRRAMGVLPDGAPDSPQAAPENPKQGDVKEKKAKATVKVGGTHSQHASGDGSIQIGSMGSNPTKRRG